MKILLRLKAWQLFVLIMLPIMVPTVNIICGAIYAFGVVIYVGWIFSIGYTMHSFIKLQSKPKIIYFKMSCLTFLTILMAFHLPLNSINEYLFGALFVMGIASMLYSFSFAARMLESAIEGEIVNRSDSLKALFYIWFFPIGIWYLHPAIKQVLAKQDSGH